MISNIKKSVKRVIAVVNVSLFTMTFSFSLLSCEDLELEPKNVIGEEILFRNDYGIEKYLTRIYNELPIEDFNYDLNADHPGYGYAAGGYHAGNDYWGSFKGNIAGAALEATCRGTSGNLGDNFEYWPYGRIRDINNLIEKLPNYEADLDATIYENALGEAHFLRAFYYFGMVKRYGGVPIIDEVQNPRDSLQQLQVPRSTEYECWKFIQSDLEYAMQHGSTDRSNLTRANRYTAAALMSRAMLYAGSVAKYGGNVGISGPAVSAGLMGMPSTAAREFFQASYDAAKFLHDAGFTLHSGNDKEQAYVEVFANENDKDEDIFIKKYGQYASRETYDKSALLHMWDDATLPLGDGLAQNIGSGLQPVYELISLYELPAIEDAEGRPVRFDHIDDLWKNGMEARCRANFFFSGMTEPSSGTRIDCQAGLYLDYPGTVEDGCPDLGKQGFDQPGTYNGDRLKFSDNNRTLTYNYNGTEVPLRGTHGYYTGLGDEGTTYTGAYIRKYTNPSTTDSRGLFKSNQPFKVFRYGEVLMNWAEAAYELGLETGSEALKQEAFQLVNEIRDRAGATRHDMVANPEDVGTELYGYEVDENLQYIRDERSRELCFESITYWDFRRWRISDALFQNYKPHILNAYYVASEGKYIFLPQYEEHMGRQLTFQKFWYYGQIPGGEINKNPKLVRNDGY